MMAVIRVDIGAAGFFLPLFVTLCPARATMLEREKIAVCFVLVNLFNSACVEVQLNSAFIFGENFGEIDFRQLQSPPFCFCFPSHQSNDLQPLILPALSAQNTFYSLTKYLSANCTEYLFDNVQTTFKHCTT